MIRSRTLALSLLVASLGCGDDVTGPAAECTDDTGSVSLTVTSATPPVFNWDPACSVALFLIEEGASDQWGISTDDAFWSDAAQANLISPPVTYGVVPNGAEQFGPPETLQAGVTYEAILWRVLPDGSPATCVQRSGNLCLLAVHEFTR